MLNAQLAATEPAYQAVFVWRKFLTTRSMVFQGAVARPLEATRQPDHVNEPPSNPAPRFRTSQPRERQESDPLNLRCSGNLPTGMQGGPLTFCRFRCAFCAWRDPKLVVYIPRSVSSRSLPSVVRDGKERRSLRRRLWIEWSGGRDTGTFSTGESARNPTPIGSRRDRTDRLN